MSDKNKTKEQLIKELSALRKRVTELEKSEFERNNVEEKHKKTEEQHKISIEFLSDGYLRVDLKGKITDCNSVFLNHTGYSREDIVNKRFTKLPTLRKKDIPQYIKMFNSAIRGKIQKPIEYKWIHKDGTTRWGETYFGITRKKRRISGFNIITRDITERKRAEEVLRAEKNSLVSVFEAMEDGVYIVNKNYDIEYVNPVLKKEFGSWEGRKCFNYFHDRDKVCPWCKNKDVLAGKTVRWEWYSFKNQKTYDLLDTPLKNPDGSISKLEIFRDITERKKAEQELKINEEKYRSLVESSEDPIYLVNKECEYLFMNSKNLSRLGTSLNQLIGKKYSLFHSKENTEIFQKKIGNVFKTGESLIHEHQSERDGRSFIRTLSPVKDERGKIVSITVISKDITEQKKAEKKLGETADLLRATLESTDNGILVVDNDDKVITVNEIFAELWKIPDEILATKDDNKLLNYVLDQLSDPKQFLDKVNDLYNKPEAVSFDTLYFKDGRIFERYSQPLLIKGQAEGRVWSFRNVTEHKKAEEVLKKHTFELRTLSEQLMNAQEKERQRISRELHDEMGQVLTMMKLDLSSIKATLPPEQFSGIKEKWKELDSLTENMLERTHQMTLDLRPHMLDDLGLISTLRWYTNNFSERLNIDVKFKAENWEENLTPELKITLYRIVQEAFTNISKYAQAKNVLLNMKRLKKSIKLKIEDDGQGFDQEEVERRRQKEHGVGLLGMRERASLFKGTCTIESVPGEGTRVEVTIPLR